MNPPRSPEVDVRARAIYDRLDALVDAQNRTTQALGDLTLVLNAVLIASAGTTLTAVGIRGTLSPSSAAMVQFAQQLRDMAATLGSDSPIAEQVDFSSGHPWAARGAPGGRT